MERNDRKTRKSFIIVFIIINLVLSLPLLYLSYQNYQKLQNNQKEKDKIKQEYQELLNKDDLDFKEIEEINKKIDDLNNIDNNTKSEKEKVFKLASELEKKIKNKESKYKIAYLTFDDGPYYNTYKVLDILKKNHVKATFFTTNVNGTYCYDNKKHNCQELYAMYAKDNHTIANHTYTHGWNRGLYKSASSFISAVKKQEDLIKSKTGIITNIVRFPGGSGTPKAQGGNGRFNQMVAELKKNGYGWVDWTAQDGDGGSLTSRSQGWSTFTKSINEDIEVVLFHDYHAITTNMLPDVIKYLQERNYIILPLFYESVTINK